MKEKCKMKCPNCEKEKTCFPSNQPEFCSVECWRAWKLSEQEVVIVPTSSYTSKEAEDDGILFDITTLNAEWQKGMFNYVTTNLLNRGYLGEDGNMKIVNIVDLLTQAFLIVKKSSKDFTEFDQFFDGTIELPDGSQQKIFIAQNESSKFTIMLLMPSFA